MHYYIHFSITLNDFLNRFDYLEVFDGDSDQRPIIRSRLCGTKFPPFESTGSKIFLRFRSDASNSQMGFAIHYYPIGNWFRHYQRTVPPLQMIVQPAI